MDNKKPAKGKREQFSSRLGFILISAGCAIGLGNIWRFPYIVGEYGGAAFVLLYLAFLVLFGLPIMTMEFAVGRASQSSAAKGFDQLEPPGSKWHVFKWVCFVGNFLLMMFFTVISGWMLAYVFKFATGTFNGLSVEQVSDVFTSFLASPVEVVGWTFLIIILGFFVCSLGLQEGVERVTKVMMGGLFVILIVLCARSVTLPGASEGLAFYLIPDFSRMFENGLSSFGEVAFAAMGQSFFTLSIGIYSMAIFGSYIGKDRRLLGEALNVGILDTSAALMAGLIIFPACFAFGVNPGQGPGLVMQTLPNIFDQMAFGQVWGTLFFLFMSFAACSTVIAVFENIMAFAMEQWGWSRKKASLVNGGALLVLSLPCALGFNVLSGVQVPGLGDILGVQDFIVSNNLLPIGSLVFVLFCTTRFGWGWKNFKAEANSGEKGLKVPQWMFYWMKYVVPVLIIMLLCTGYVPLIQSWFGG